MGQKHGVVIQGFSDLPSDRTLAVMAPKDARDLTPVTTLGEYEHRGDEIYAFGHDHLYLYQSELEGLDHTVVTIPAPGCEMFSHQAAAIVLYDRMVRGG